MTWVGCPDMFQSTLPVWGATTRQTEQYGKHYGFNPRSPCGERRRGTPTDGGGQLFQSTLPVWGATRHGLLLSHHATFQSTLPVWGATRHGLLLSHHATFQSTLPVWGATPTSRSILLSTEFQSTLPVWGATGRDVETADAERCFNPRSPCGERPPKRAKSSTLISFQSTLPVWGATMPLPLLKIGPDVSIHAPRVGSDMACRRRAIFWRCFNPRSPCGERHFHPTRLHSRETFQSTLPVWGATADGSGYWRSIVEFQSTLPVWGATAATFPVHSAANVSIHAPRVGSDVPSPVRVISIYCFNPRSPCGERPTTIRSAPFLRSFNPRSPCGERPLKDIPLVAVYTFQSTLPVWGATSAGCAQLSGNRFQSTLPVWGATLCKKLSAGSTRRFNPRSPCGERQAFLTTGRLNTQFQSTLPVWGAT